MNLIDLVPDVQNIIFSERLNFLNDFKTLLRVNKYFNSYVTNSELFKKWKRLYERSKRIKLQSKCDNCKEFHHNYNPRKFGKIIKIRMVAFMLKESEILTNADKFLLENQHEINFENIQGKMEDGVE